MLVILQPKSKTYDHMGKKVRISDESVNCYGTRILTSGIDLAQYNRNPVLLYMHERGKVVGLMKNLEVKDGELHGELEFDKASPLSEQLEKQYEFGSLRMVSANFCIQETSDDESLIMEGQTRQTVTKCQLFEVSCVDIGGNDNALVLSDSEGNMLPLSGKADGKGLLPLLKNNTVSNPLNKVTEMETKQLALSLGLAETATEAEISAKINEMKLTATKAAILQKENEQIQLGRITDAVDNAIKEKRIAATMKDHFVELGKKVGLDSLTVTLQAMQPQEKLSDQVHLQSPSVQGAQATVGTYQKFSDIPADQILLMRKDHREEYIRLYKAEFGFEPDLSE